LTKLGNLLFLLKNSFMNITIIGTGYVGIVTGACFAEKGNKVICVDNDGSKVESLKKGEVTIYEPDLSDLVKKNYQNGNLSFTTDIEFGVKQSEIIFFCLPTPQGGDGQADLKIVLHVSSQIAQYFNNPKIIVNKSTVPVGTSKLVKECLSSNNSSTFEIASNPEFLREGSAVYDFMNPDRVVIGAENDQTKQKLIELYLPFVPSQNQILTTDIASSELIKYAANSFLATKISFINEISNLAEHTGADITDVAKGMGMDPRIGSKFLQAGIGYGGSCFPKDVAALDFQGRKLGLELELVKATIKTNQKQRQTFLKKIHNYFEVNSNLKKEIALLGLAFKPETDDVRESVAVDLIKQFSQKYQISAYDPKALETFQKFNPNLEVEYKKSYQEAISGKKLIVILTEWSEFRTPEFINFLKQNKIQTIFDGRNMFDLDFMQTQDFEYISVGRKNILTTN
jgi:UDPglucose 6-dehydrogenase